MIKYGIKKTAREKDQADRSAKAVCAKMGRHQEILAEARKKPQDTRHDEALETRKDKGIIMDHCLNCEKVFAKGSINNDIQKIVGSGYISDMQYCPQCKRAYNPDGSLMEIDGEAAYFDGRLNIAENVIDVGGEKIITRRAIFGRLTTNKNLVGGDKTEANEKGKEKYELA